MLGRRWGRKEQSTLLEVSVERTRLTLKPTGAVYEEVLRGGKGSVDGVAVNAAAP
jgi:hypothetical protein